MRERICVWIAMAAVVSGGGIGYGEEKRASAELRCDSFAPHIHQISLYDETGEVVDVTDEETAQPYSPRMTCGKCHAYDVIGSGWHFNAGEKNAPDGRPGEPWILTDSATGTQLPLSYRKWPGAYRPDAVGISPWKFTLLFGAHFPGGGMPEKAFDQKGASRRWPISGRLEIDCLLCHGELCLHNPIKRGKELAKQNFRWAPTVAAGLAVVRGSAKTLPDDFDPMMPANPDYPDQKLPQTIYTQSKFDADDHATIPAVRKPSPGRCYFCHTVIDCDGNSMWRMETNVHLASGMVCVDCHRNGLDHMITRGYEKECEVRKDPFLASYTCRGCHLGSKTKNGVPAGNHFGAPYPRHVGLPRFHLEVLSCAACHSGPWPGKKPRRIRTALAHGLGMPKRGRHTDDPPRIVAPVFARTADGKIAPHRMMWPSFWGEMKGNKIKPLPIDIVQEAAKKLVSRDEDKKSATRLSPDKVKKLFDLLGVQKKDVKGEIVYVHGGMAYRKAKSGKLVAFKNEAAAPYAWPLAHDVRPARQALGARDCSDCHSTDSPLFFGSVIPDSNPPDGEVRPIRMYEFEGVSPLAMIIWAWVLKFHVLFAGVLFLSVAAIGIVLVRSVLTVLVSVVLEV